MRESSKESSGVPLDSNLWTKPEPGSAKKTFPSESAANAAGVSSFPGPWPLSPHAFRNSKGGSCTGMGAGSVGFAHDKAHNAVPKIIHEHALLQMDESKWAWRKILSPGIVRSLRPNHTTRIRSAFRQGKERIGALGVQRSIKKELKRSLVSRRLDSGGRIPAKAILCSV